MNASENASYRNACLLHLELITGLPNSESDSGPPATTTLRKERHSSGDSFDSAFENEEAHQRQVTFVKVRSYSECGESSPPARRGILKRFSNNRVRFYSESSAEIFSFENVQETGSCQQMSFEEEDDHSREQDSDENDSDKVKKTVRFSDTVHKQLFRSNSSILGQRKKNQRKQRNKKRREEEKLSSSTESMDQMTDSLEQLVMDSGTEVDIDVDSESGNEAVAPKAEPVASKKNKKHKKGRNRRKSMEADLMFDLDL